VLISITYTLKKFMTELLERTFPQKIKLWICKNGEICVRVCLSVLERLMHEQKRLNETECTFLFASNIDSAWGIFLSPFMITIKSIVIFIFLFFVNPICLIRELKFFIQIICVLKIKKKSLWVVKINKVSLIIAISMSVSVFTV